MSRLTRTAQAEEDLIEIWLHIGANDPVAADLLLDRLDKRSHLLADNPKLGPSRQDIAPGLRYFPLGNYLILYRITGSGIQVVRYIHGARDIFTLALPPEESP